MVAVLATASRATAGAPPSTIAPDTEPPATRIERYGTQVALADAAWLAGTLVLAKVEDSSTLAGVTFELGAVFAGPIVHVIHGNRSGAMKSLGTRVLLPAAGFLVGWQLDASERSPTEDENDLLPEGFDGGVLGLMAGLAGALIIDWTVFAKHEVPADRSFATGLRPGVKISRDGLAVSLGGSF